MQAAGLVSPEAQLATSPLIIGYFDAMRSLARIGGVTHCSNGFGERSSLTGRARSGGLDRARDCTFDAAGLATADTFWDFAPTSPSNAASTVGELDLLLTGGRMSNKNKGLISRFYSEQFDADEPRNALGTLRCP